MAQGMRSMMFETRAQSLQSRSNDMIDSAATQRMVGWIERQEDFAPSYPWPHLFKVANDRRSNCWRQRELLSRAEFRPMEDDHPPIPVQMLQLYTLHFAPAHTVNGEQQNNGAITDGSRMVLIELG